MEKQKTDDLSKNNRYFFEVIKGELEKIPVKVFVNIKNKQKYMAQNVDKITNILREVIKNPQVFSQSPGISKAFNQLLEDSGLSPIDFSQMTNNIPLNQNTISSSVLNQPSVQSEQTPVEGEKLLNKIK
jgi:RNAse (barnase) inhibitor barstar